MSASIVSTLSSFNLFIIVQVASLRKHRIARRSRHPLNGHIQLFCVCQSADLGSPIVQKAALVTQTAVQMLVLGAGCGIWTHIGR